MTQEEIQERNKQIALMLGWYHEDYIWKMIKPFMDGFISEIKDVELQFHTDWNRLMEAIQFLQRHFESKERSWTSIHRYPLYTDIGEVFVLVSDFAKHYNEGKL
jgi:hypothetical protein